MKKHPVDDLFKRKLSDVEKQPSAGAWARIQNEQINNGRRFAGWIWYAAASIIIAIMTGYVVWQEWQKDSQNFTVEKTIAIAKKYNVQKVISSAEPLKHEDSSTIKVEAEIPVAAVIKNKIMQKSVDSDELALVNKATLKADLKDKIEVRSTEIEQLISKSFEVSPINTPQSIASSVQLDIEKEIAPQKALASIEEKQENRTIVVNVDEPESDSNEKHKSSRFTKVFRQLKNVRAGEPVDWKDMGFNPKTIVAKVDERIRDKEEVISEKYQNIKGRTKL